MIYNNLLKYSFEFIKEAGLLKVPEKTLREVEEWALSVYFTRMCNSYFLPKLKDLGPLQNKQKNIFSWKFSNSDVIRKELQEVLLECKRFITKKISSNTTFYIKSPFSDRLYSFGGVFLFEDSERRKGYWDSEEIKYQNDIEDDDIFKLGYLTLWFGLGGIGFPYDARIIEKKANEIKMYVRHELQHMVQTIIKVEFKQTDDKIQLSQNIRKSKIVSKFDLEKHLVHAHKDVEFFTDLSDSIDDFKSAIKKIPKQIHKLYFEYWIAKIDIEVFYDEFKKLNVEHFSKLQEEEKEIMKYNNEIFQSWKNREPEKYKKAVKEFYKEVQDLL